MAGYSGKSAPVCLDQEQEQGQEPPCEEPGSVWLAARLSLRVSSGQLRPASQRLWPSSHSEPALSPLSMLQTQRGEATQGLMSTKHGDGGSAWELGGAGSLRDPVF